MTHIQATPVPVPERSASGAVSPQEGLRIVRAPVHEARARAELVAMAGTLAGQEGVAVVELSRQDGGLAMSVTFDDARRRDAWLVRGEGTIVAGPSAPPQPIQPPFWKRWSLSMIAVYPALILLVYLTRPLTAEMHDAVALFIVAFLLTGLSTGLIMPFLSRRLGRWLAAR